MSDARRAGHSPVGRASLPAFKKSDPLEPIFSQYRHDLPHWRLTGATYFVTWRIDRFQPELNPIERDLVASAIHYFDNDRYDLFAWVVMNDHAHALVKPRAGHELEGILHSWKSYTARQLQRSHGRVGRVWQAESFDRIVRDEEEFWEKAKYIAENPRRRWPATLDYLWFGINIQE